MKDKLKELLKQLKNAGKVYIQPHNIPDPDSIASSLGIKFLLDKYGIKSKIIHVQTIEKANSKKMVELFNIKMTVKNEMKYNKDDFVILVDTQLGNSNVTNLIKQNVMVIDHHEIVNDTDTYLFKDIRSDIGACSSIVAEYFYVNDIPLTVNVATALLYGIMMDTDNLSRRVNDLDIEMFYFLYNQAEISMIKSLKLNQIVKSDLIAYAKALNNVEIYGYLGFVHIEDCNDSLLGTISDMVNTIEGVSVVVAYAKRADGVKFSIRSESTKIKANKLMRFIMAHRGVGGGHDEMAGGFMPADKMDFLNNKRLDTFIRHRAINYVEKEDSDL
ncbi:DHH family phosphoesterase [Vallitalea guaymasensis]|uniref:DHH family phosphoesterase n=1 Tax=Vallitalea guaymasensis TaxID=1185412 RepID=A0A8J8M9D1_9FIRM|nr:DHH family phosphoesterase [Vallitalea guaymasensis]QUH28618.1 DHH family phosphoesterase [Vallitalea guaymasensis]